MVSPVKRDVWVLSRVGGSGLGWAGVGAVELAAVVWPGGLAWR